MQFSGVKMQLNQGRLAHAQGTGTIVADRDFEGIGETLRLSGLPSAESIEGLAERIAEIVMNPALKREIMHKNMNYIREFYFPNQTRKHLMIYDAIINSAPLPVVDKRDIDYYKHKASMDIIRRLAA